MKYHPAIKLSLLFVIGIVVGKIIVLPFPVFLITIFISLILFLLNLKYQNGYLRFTVIILISFSLIAIGNVYLNINKPHYKLLPEKIYKESNIKLIGEITDIHLKKENEIEFVANSKSILIDSILFDSGYNFLCKIKDKPEQLDSLFNCIKIGNIIRISGNYAKGREGRNPGEFDYNKYLRSKGISGVVTSYNVTDIKLSNAKYKIFANSVLLVRKFLDNTIHKLYNDESASLLRGLLLADRSEISYETKNEFINSGVIHILAVSGLHVGYIVLIFVFLFGRLNIYLRSILTVIGLVIFLVLINSPPSAFRASIMAIILIVAFLTSRSTNLLNSVSIAALILLIINPNQLFTAGFQLSFSAVISIAVIYPLIRNYLQSKEIKSILLKNILLFSGVSIAAQIGTLPFTIYYFGKISVIALLVNLIVIPVVGVIVAVGIFSIVLGIFTPLFASYFVVVNELIIKYTFFIIHITGSSHYSFFRISNFSLVDLSIFYLFLSIFLYFIIRFRNSLCKILLLIFCLFNFLLFSTFDNYELLQDNKLSVIMIDVGQGDSFLIKFPNGKTALIDAGEANYFFDNGERVILPLLNNFGINKIDYGFVSHIDLDHYGGFVSLIHNNKIDQIYKPSIDSTEEKDIKFEKYLYSHKIKPKYYSKEILKIGNARVYILNDNIPENYSSNNKSGLLKIVYGKSKFLFTGDLEKEGEGNYINEYGNFLDSDVLKVGHHGSITSSSKEFLKYVSPDISLISDGIKNKFNHPSPVIVDRLKEIGSKIYRTDISGAVLLQSDGKNIKNIDWGNM